MSQEENLAEILQRTNLKLPFDEFLEQVAHDFPSIGSIKSHFPIVEGYEDANIKLSCSGGVFVLKIFSHDRTKENVESYVRAIVASEEIEFPTMKIVKSSKNFLEQANQTEECFYILTEYFDGLNFDYARPSIDECVHIATHLENFNTLNFAVAESYDSWGNKNLVQEFEQSKDKLDAQVRELVEAVVTKLRELDSSQFSTGVIHGDMQRKHVLKSESGEFCVLDFGCMRNDALVYDLSTYLAWFCLQPDSWEHREEIFEEVTKAYAAINHNPL